MTRILSILLLLPFLCLGQSTEVGPVGNTPQKIDTLAGLVGRPGTNSQMLVVLGHSAVGDWGGQRNAVFEAASTQATNLGCVFEAPGGRWKFPDCESGEVKVEWFGAVSGMYTNSHTPPNVIGIDSTEAIQSAIDWLTSRGGGDVMLGEGIYWTTNTIFLKPRVALRGLSGGIGLEEVRWGIPPPGENSRLTGASYISGWSPALIGFPLVVLDGPRDFSEMYVASFKNIDGDLVSYYATGGCAVTDIGFQIYQWQFGAEGSGYPIAGVVAREINGLEIARCAFLTMTGHGVYLYGAQGTTVKNCIMHVTFEPAIFVTYVSDCWFFDNIITSPVVFYRANTHTVSRNSIYNTLFSWVNYLNTGVDVSEYGVTRKYIVEKVHNSDETNDTFYTDTFFGANRGAMVYFVGTNQPAPFTLTNMYFVCPGPTPLTIRLASSPKNALANNYIDILETKTNGTWSLTGPNQPVHGFECEELFVNNNRMDQSFQDAVLMRRCVRGTINDNQFWEPGQNQMVFRQNKNTTDTNVACVVLDESRNFQVSGNMMHGYYAFSLNNSIKQISTYGIRSVSSSDIAISGNSYDRLSYGTYADERSVNVRSYDNLSSDTVPYVAVSAVTNGVNSRLWEGVRLSGTNLLASSAIPDSKTNITDFSIALTISDWSLRPAAIDEYIPLLLLSPENKTNFTGSAVTENSLAVFGFQNGGFTNLNLIVSLQGSSTNYRRGILPIREWHDKRIPLEMIISRSGSNFTLFANGTMRTFSMTITNGDTPPDASAPINGKHLSFGGWFDRLYYDGWLHSLGLWDRAFTFYDIRDHKFRNNDAILLWNFRGDVMDTVKDGSTNGVDGTLLVFDSATRHQFGPSFNPGFVEEAYSGGPWVRSNGTWVAMGGPYLLSSGGPYLPLAGGAMVGPVTSSSTWQGTSFTGTSFTGSNYLGTNFTGSGFIARGASSGLQMFGRSTLTNYWNLYTGPSNMVWYYNPGVGGGYNPFVFYTNGAITTLQGTVWNSGNDGSGSTLDADLLDGFHASSFLTDAPSNGSVYGRSNATWAVVSSGTSYSFTNGLTNSANVVSWAALPGGNISFTTNNGQITIAALTVGTNSGTPVSVDGGSTLSAANFTDTARINLTASGTNVSADLISASVSTNYIDATFHGLLTAADLVGSGTNIFVNAALVSLANLQDDTGPGGINFVVSGSNIKAYATNVPTGGTNSGTAVSVDGAASLAIANLADSPELNPTASGSNITYAIVANSIGTNKLADANLITLAAGEGGFLTAASPATNATQFVTLAQLQESASGDAVNYFDTASFATGFTTTGTVLATNYMSTVVPSQATNAAVTAANGQYIAKFISTNTFTQLVSGLAVVQVYTFENSPGSGELTAEVYIVNSVTKAEEFEFTPSPAYQTVTAGASPVLMTFSVPITDYTSTTNFHVAIKLKVQESSTPDPTIRIVSGGIYPSHVSYNLASTSYVLKSGDTMTGDLNVPDEVYGAGWDGSTEVPTKNALYDKIQTLSSGSGLGTNIFVNGSLVSLANLTNNTSASGINWVVNGSNISGYATNASSSYISKSVSQTVVSNTTDETVLYTWTVPASTLSSDGDELEIYVPAKYTTYSAQPSGYTWTFYKEYGTGSQGSVATLYSATLNASVESFAADWTFRIKRMSSTNAMMILKHTVGANTGTNVLVQSSRVMDSVLENGGWGVDTDFALTVTHGVANAGHITHAKGYTVRKLQ